ncbi:uncharacterized protein PAC_03604 [Phialocephala subalpina]|uniref:Uncharacterized protein n=1 Tax=Phialocephala subalpina TaxID=576137 RepID=A0A1L7WLT2_9HELO|nr:uncharacterized protein PAC_03604 [Phialocephala subalpina]
MSLQLPDNPKDTSCTPLRQVRWPLSIPSSLVWLTNMYSTSTSQQISSTAQHFYAMSSLMTDLGPVPLDLPPIPRETFLYQRLRRHSIEVSFAHGYRSKLLLLWTGRRQRWHRPGPRYEGNGDYSRQDQTALMKRLLDWTWEKASQHIPHVPEAEIDPLGLGELVEVPPIAGHFRVFKQTNVPNDKSRKFITVAIHGERIGGTRGAYSVYFGPNSPPNLDALITMKAEQEWQEIHTRIKNLEAADVSVSFWRVEPKGIYPAIRTTTKIIRQAWDIDGARTNQSSHNECEQYWPTTAPKNPAAQQLARRVGIEFQGEPRARILDSLRRLMRTGNASQENFELLFGPTWDTLKEQIERVMDRVLQNTRFPSCRTRGVFDTEYAMLRPKTKKAEKRIKELRNAPQLPKDIPAEDDVYRHSVGGWHDLNDLRKYRLG